VSRDPLKRRRTTSKTVAVATENIDEFITGEDPGERRWESLSLTQRQDARIWIRHPLLISGLQFFLEVFTDDWQESTSTSLLDVGCYGGYLLDYLERQEVWLGGHSYLGIDINADVIRAAQEEHIQVKNVKFAVGDVFHLARDFRSFDYVWCSRVLIHLPYFERALESLLRVAERRLYLVLLIGEESCQKIQIWDEDLEEESFFYHRTVTEKQIRDAAGDRRFTIHEDADGGRYSLVIFEEGQ